jgi:hypothetical protein
MKVAVSNSGNNFFDADVMAFWGSKIETGIIAGHYYITSEDNFDRSRRMFTIRYFTQDAPHLMMSGNEVGEFQQFPTITDAQVFLADYLADVEGAQ